MQGLFDSAEVTALEARVGELQMLISAMAMIMADDKGKVRINKNVINKVNGGKIENLGWHTNSAGAVIMDLTMASAKK